MQMKNYRGKFIFIILFQLVLFIPCYLIVWGIDDGTISEGAVWAKFSLWYYDLLSVPFAGLISKQLAAPPFAGILFLLGVVADALFYSILTLLVYHIYLKVASSLKPKSP